MNATELLNKLIHKQNLTGAETEKLLSGIMQGTITPLQAAAIITALAAKGETQEEISGLIKVMRRNMIPIKTQGAIDVCGTGGDNSDSFNISTAVSFVVAGAGVPVVKHGNSAASSKCGSADVLKELGINIMISPQQTAAVLKKVGMVFLFAPLYHPSMKQVGAIRKELKIRTVFNFLGPFVNPANVKRQLIGVPNKKIAEQLAHVAQDLNYEHLLIVSSTDGLDEISTNSKTYLFEIKNKTMKKSVIDPLKYGYKNNDRGEIKGGDIKENAEHIKKILKGEKGPKRDIVILNSAFALYVAGAAKTIKKGILIAEQSIDSGSAQTVLNSLIKHTHKL